MKRGLFITFEGMDGSGKSTQWRRLAAALEELNIPFVSTREPGGTSIGQKIRSILLSPENSELKSLPELFLFLANRAQNLAQIVEPALKEGKMVLSDRHRDSSTALQGGGRGLGVKTVEELNRWACGETEPDCTILINIPANKSLARAKVNVKDKGIKKGSGDRIEQGGDEFHQRIFDTFNLIAKQEPERFLIVDGLGSKDEVSGRVFIGLAKRYPKIFSRLPHLPIPQVD